MSPRVEFSSVCALRRGAIRPIKNYMKPPVHGDEEVRRRGSKGCNTLCWEHSSNNISATRVAEPGRGGGSCRWKESGRHCETSGERTRDVERQREREEMVAYQKLPQRSLDEETLECTPEGERRSCGETQCDRSDDFQQRELLQFTVFPAFFSRYSDVVPPRQAGAADAFVT